MTTTAIDAKPVVEVRDVTVRFGALVAVDSVTLAVPPQSLVGLVGPNGAGKSTLFDVISGLRRPSDGAVFLDGRDATSLSAQKRSLQGMARTFQRTEMFTRLTVKEHLVLADRLRFARNRLWSDLFTGRGLGRPQAGETERVDALLDRFDLGRLANREVAGLPLGTCRMVELARALALKPKILLLDEPGSGLDSAERERLADTLRTVTVVDEMAVLLVEHDVELVLSVSDHVYVLSFGTRIASGVPSEIRANKAVQSAYLGDLESTSEGGHR